MKNRQIQQKISILHVIRKQKPDRDHVEYNCFKFQRTVHIVTVYSRGILNCSNNVWFSGRRQSKTLILSTNVDKKLPGWRQMAIENTIFRLAIFDPSSSIVKSVFDCRLIGVRLIRLLILINAFARRDCSDEFHKCLCKNVGPLMGAFFACAISTKGIIDLKDICYKILPMLKYVRYFAYSLFYAWAIHL